MKTAGLILFCILFAATPGLADPPGPATSYEIPTSGHRDPPAVSLNGTLTLHLLGAMPNGAASAVLRIDGVPLGVDPQIDQNGKQLSFILERTSDKDNRVLWSRLLGFPFAHQTADVPVSLEIGGTPLTFHTDPTNDKLSAQPAMQLVAFDTGRMVLGLLFVALVMVTTVLMCAKTTMARDPGIPQLRRPDRPFSLGRVQMAFWFCLIVASFVFIGLLTSDMSSIAAQSFVLLGISAATALGPVAVDQTKDSPISQIQAGLADMGISSAADVEKLMAANAGAAADAIVPGAKIGANLNPTAGQLVAEYENRIAAVKSDGFLRDIVNDINGPTIHRWQIVIWTIILGGVYVATVYATLETPNFDSNLLALMGISGATYIGFKIPEEQFTS